MRPALSLVASVDLFKPPADWFEDPHLSGPSPIVVTEEGRVFGHLATWGTCHIGLDGVCTEAPASASNYAYFRTGAVLADNGEHIPTGNLTMDTGHADIDARARPAMAHYDNTGTVTANVAAGEDEYGIWVSGAIPPGLPPEKVFAMRASALSGDWRDIGGNLELVAALHVNVQGFPIPRVAIAASGGHQTALVAAGIVLTASRSAGHGHGRGDRRHHHRRHRRAQHEQGEDGGTGCCAHGGAEGQDGRTRGTRGSTLRGSTMAPCNCEGARTSSSVRHIYTNPQGRQTSYNTEIEARAAQVRAGGGGSIRTEAK